MLGARLYIVSTVVRICSFNTHLGLGSENRRPLSSKQESLNLSQSGKLRDLLKQKGILCPSLLYTLTARNTTAAKTTDACPRETGISFRLRNPQRQRRMINFEFLSLFIQL